VSQYWQSSKRSAASIENQHLLVITTLPLLMLFEIEDLYQNSDKFNIKMRSKNEALVNRVELQS